MNEIIFDQNFAYFLGFFWGDGALRCNNKPNTPVISIVSEDAIFVRKSIPSWLLYTEKTYSQEQRRERTSFYFKDKALKNFLVLNGAMNKSWENQDEILSKIPVKFHYLFWRGFVDADGCFYKSRSNRKGCFSIASSLNQDWSSVESWLRKINVENYKIYRKRTATGNSSVIEVKYGQDILKIGRYLYADNLDTGLPRKQLKFGEIKNCLEKLTSEYKGISLHKGSNKWRAYHKRLFLGWFSTEKAAHEARVKYLNHISP